MNKYVQLHYIYHIQYYYKKGCITAYILVQILANTHTTYTHVKSNFIQILACKIKTTDKYKKKNISPYNEFTS